VNRLADILPKIISIEQDNFVKNRQIDNGIILMHETLHSIKTLKEEAIIIKLDMEKAYDSLLEIFGSNLGYIWFPRSMENMGSKLHLYNNLFCSCQWRGNKFLQFI